MNPSESDGFLLGRFLPILAAPHPPGTAAEPHAGGGAGHPWRRNHAAEHQWRPGDPSSGDPAAPEPHKKPNLTGKTFCFPAQESQTSNCSQLPPALSSPSRPLRCLPAHASSLSPVLNPEGLRGRYKRQHRMLLDRKASLAPRPPLGCWEHPTAVGETEAVPCPGSPRYLK